MRFKKIKFTNYRCFLNGEIEFQEEDGKTSISSSETTVQEKQRCCLHSGGCFMGLILSS